MTWQNPLVALDAEADLGGQKRSDPRRNIFVAAVLCHDGTSTPVRVRNMSRSGALVECAAPPAVQSGVRLCRGSLSVRGSVVWLRGERAGIRFDSDVDVAAWLPKGNRPEGQAQVDAIVDAYRSQGADGLYQYSSPAPAASNLEVVVQLLQIRDSLNRAADELAGNSAITAEHAAPLQAIDLNAHRLDKLAGILAAGGQIPPSTGS